MSTYYPDQKVSTSGIAGAIALAALHDVRVNSLGIAERKRGQIYFLTSDVTADGQDAAAQRDSR